VTRPSATVASEGSADVHCEWWVTVVEPPEKFASASSCRVSSTFIGMPPKLGAAIDNVNVPGGASSTVTDCVPYVGAELPHLILATPRETPMTLPRCESTFNRTSLHDVTFAVSFASWNS
jgi:hypothetical protein